MESAIQITDRIYGALEHLQKHPNMGVSCKDKMLRLEGYRMFICDYYLRICRVYHIVDGRTNYTRIVEDLPKVEDK